MEYRINNLPVAAHPHMHENPEFIYVLSGVFNVSVGDESFRLNPGELMAASPYTEHSATVAPIGRTEIICVTPNLKCLSGCSNRVKTFIDELREQKQYFRAHINVDKPYMDEIRALFIRIGELSERQDDSVANDFALMSCIYEIMSWLYKHGLSEHVNSKCNPDLEFIHTVTKYIETNYWQKLSTSKICEDLNYSKSYFCARFKKTFGEPFMNYLCRSRIEHSMFYGENPDFTLSDIARQVGFEDYCYFSHMFRRYTGLSPREYFKK
ncbi:MAG: AraC family transcriptional regulator [Clostridiales bacterium]|nr:AraC family transcriptional regulator [Clostridiales bacterium]